MSQNNLNEKNDDDSDNSADKKNKRKPFVERVGDWVCVQCKNLNFSFRVVCNRCQLPKSESEKMLESYMSNLMNYVQYNEMIQKKIINNHGPYGNLGSSKSSPGYLNNNSININNNYYHNYPNVPTQNYMNNFHQRFAPNFGNGVSYSNSSKGIGKVGNLVSNGNFGNSFGMSSIEGDEDLNNEEM